MTVAITVQPDKCLVCASDDQITLFDQMLDYEYGIQVPPMTIVKCKKCGLVNLNPMPSREDLDRYYPVDYANVHGDNSWARKVMIESSYSRTLANIRKLVPPTANILDVGCSSGQLIDYFGRIEKDWSITGIEVDQSAVEVGWNLGRKNIIMGSFEDVNLPQGSFDLLMINHVIEHVIHPDEMLEKAFSLLKTDGKLYLETPNTQSIDFKIFGKYWGGLHYPRHTYLFSAQNLESLLRRVGFNDVSFSTTFDVFGWALSVQNYLSDHIQVKKTNGRMPLYSLLMLGFLPVVLAQKIIGVAPAMRVIASK